MIAGGVLVVCFLTSVSAVSVHLQEQQAFSQDQQFLNNGYQQEERHAPSTVQNDDPNGGQDPATSPSEHRLFYSFYDKYPAESQYQPMVTIPEQMESQQQHNNEGDSYQNEQRYFEINPEQQEQPPQQLEYTDFQNEQHQSFNNQEEYMQQFSNEENQNQNRRQELYGHYSFGHQQPFSIVHMSHPQQQTQSFNSEFTGEPLQSSNFVQYSLQVKHPKHSLNVFPNEDQNSFKTFTDKPADFEQNILKHSYGPWLESDKGNFEEFLESTNFKLHNNVFIEEKPLYFGQPASLKDPQGQSTNEYDPYTVIPQIQPLGFSSILNRPFNANIVLPEHHHKFHNGLRPFSFDSQQLIFAINALKSNHKQKSVKDENKLKNLKLEQQAAGNKLQNIISSLPQRYAHSLPGFSYNFDDEATKEYGDDDEDEEDTSSNHFHYDGNIKTITFTEKVPVPVKVEKKIPVPIKVPFAKPYPVYISKPVPVRVHRPYPVPVKIPVPKLYPVQKLVPMPYKVPVPRSYPVPVIKPYPVYVVKRVPFAVVKHRLYPVKVPFEKPVPYAVHYNKYVPIPVYKDVPYPVKLPYKEQIKIDIEYEKPKNEPKEEFKSYADQFKKYTSWAVKSEQLPIHIPLDKLKHYDQYDNEEDSIEENSYKTYTIENIPNQYPEVMKTPYKNQKDYSFMQKLKDMNEQDDEIPEKNDYGDIREIQKERTKPVYEEKDNFVDILKIPSYAPSLHFQSSEEEQTSSVPPSDKKLKSVNRGRKRYVKKYRAKNNHNEDSSGGDPSYGMSSFREILFPGQGDFGKKTREMSKTTLREMQMNGDKEEGGSGDENMATGSHPTRDPRTTKHKRRHLLIIDRTSRNHIP